MMGDVAHEADELAVDEHGHRHVGLVRDGLEPIRDDFERDRVDAHAEISTTRLRYGSMAARSPGNSNVVESSCSITAGPAIVSPGISVTRSYTDVSSAVSDSNQTLRRD